MSYTMTMDMPTKESAYVRRRGPRFQSQLKSLVIAFVTTEMQREGFEWSDLEANVPQKSGSGFARAWGRMGVEDGELDLSRHPEHLREINPFEKEVRP